MKRSLKVCSILLAMSLLLFSCKQPEESSYIEYSPSDLTVINKTTDVRKAVTEKTPAEIKNLLNSAIEKEINNAFIDKEDELKSTNRTYQKEVNDRNTKSESFTNSTEETKSYTSSFTPNVYDLPKYNGKYDLIKDIESKSQTPTTSEEFSEFKFTLQMNLNEPNITKSFIYSTDYYDMTKEKKITTDEIPNNFFEWKLDGSRNLILYFDNGIYAGYVKLIDHTTINGSKIIEAIVEAIKVGNSLSNELIDFFDNISTPSQNVKDFINPLLETYTYEKTYIVVYDNDGKNPYTFVNKEGCFTIDEFFK